jgi:hypothetical protein
MDREKGTQAIITKGDTAWRLQVIGQKPEFGFGYGLGVRNAKPDVDVEDGEWHHLAGVYDRNYYPAEPDKKAAMLLYVDGVLEEASDAFTPVTVPTNDYEVYIGENAQLRGREWDGLISDVRVYNRTLSPAEISTLYSDTFDILTSYNHYPDKDAGGVPIDVVLSWTPGVEAADCHDVYFGTDEGAVENGEAGVLLKACHDTNSISPGILELGETYHWRVDEVNGLDVWEGNVRGFTVVGYLVVDDFEAYSLVNPIGTTWVPIQNALVYLEEAITHGGDKSMKINYYNPAASDAQVTRTFTDPCDWTIDGAKALYIWFYGQAGNDANEVMSVKLEDADSPTPGSTKVEYDGDMNDIRNEAWQLWRIDLQDFTDVNLANVKKITIGFGDGKAPVDGASGNVYFDDIRLYPSKCFDKYSLEYIDKDYEEDDPDEYYGESATLKYTTDHKYRPWADFTPFSGKCVVDYEDLDFFTDQWLADKPPGLLNGDFESGLDNWTFYLAERAEDFNVALDIVDFNGSNALAVEFGPMAKGANYELAQVIRVIPGEHYTINADWQGDAGCKDPWGDTEDWYPGWCEVLMYPIDDPTDEERLICLMEPGRTDWLADNWHPIIAKHEYNTAPGATDGEFGPEEITDAMTHGDCLGTNTIMATTPYMVVGFKIGGFDQYHLDGGRRAKKVWMHVDNLTVVCESCPQQAYRLADFNTDGDVDFVDYAEFANRWLDETIWPRDP